MSTSPKSPRTTSTVTKESLSMTRHPRSLLKSLIPANQAAGSGQHSESRPWRAKTKTGQDAGSAHGSALRATEDAPRRGFAAARGRLDGLGRAQTTGQQPEGRQVKRATTNSRTRPSRIRRASSRRRVSALLVTALCSIAALAPGSASAFIEPGITAGFADFTNCPADLVTPGGVCLHSYTTGGVVQIGNSSVPISVPGDTFDIGEAKETGNGPAICAPLAAPACAVSPPHGILNGPAQPVPGGLLGTVGNLRLTGVKAKVEWAAAVPASTPFGHTSGCSKPDPLATYNGCVFLNGKAGTAATLSVKVHLTSPFLGPNCFIGSATDPIVIALTSGVTSPPPPAQPIHGRPYESVQIGQAAQATGVKLVNNSFSVPVARGCGTSAGALVDEAINHKLGLPSPPGRNMIAINLIGEERASIGVLAAGWTGENGSPEEAGEEEGPGEGGSAVAGPSVPSGRASELVSPAAKNGLSPYAVVPSQNGEAVDFQARGALPGSSTGGLNLYRAERGTGGWQSTSLTPTPATPLGALEVQAPAWTSSDLSQTIFDTPASYNPGDEDEGALSLYASDAGGLDWLSQGTQGDSEAKSATFDAATPDGQHVVFSSGASLLPGATGLDPGTAPEAEYLYERDVAAGETHLLSLDPGGNPPSYAATTLPGGYAPGQGGLEVASVEGFFPGQIITVGSGPSAETTQILRVQIPEAGGEPILVVNNGSGLPTAYPPGTPVVHLAEGAVLGDGGNLASGQAPAGEYLPANSGSGSTTNAISADGSKVFFESPNPATAQPVGLYMRQGNSTTVKIAGATQDGSELSGFGEELLTFSSARYEGAATDGSLMFFTTEEGRRLGGGAARGGQLYEYNTTSNEIGGVPAMSASPISAGLNGDRTPATTLTATANFPAETITVASTAGFTAGEAIAFGRFASAGGKHNANVTLAIASVDSETELTLTGAVHGAGLFGVPPGTEVHGVHPAYATAISNDGSHVYFISDGVLAENENAGGAKAAPVKPNLYVFDTTSGETTFIATVAMSDVENAEGNPVGLAAEPDVSRPAVPTPDGGVLAFASAANLTGQNPWQKYTQIYRYSVSDEELQCLSCAAPGVRPTGDANFGETAGGTYAPPGLTSPMSEDGSMVFFDTPDSLVSEDKNSAAPPSAKFEDPTSTDVYQWTQAGLSLLSSGTSTTPAVLQGTNPSGSDVLFTATQTVPGQNDGGYENVIDARQGGGFPAGEGAGAPSCVGQDCRQAFGEAPVFGDPGTFSAPGEGPSSGQPKAKKHPKRKHHKKKHKHPRSHKRAKQSTVAARASAANSENSSQSAVSALAPNAITLAPGVTALAPTQATGPFGLASFDTSVSNNQAGAHADFTTSFGLNEDSLGGPSGQLKNVTVVLPEGVVGNPQATPRCTAAQLTEYDCQPSAQVGVITTRFSIPAEAEGEEPTRFEEQTPIYNMTPSPGHPATLASQLSFATILIEAEVLRDGSYRIAAHVNEISTLVPVLSSSVTLWGVPADSSHDAQRVGPPPNYGTPTRAGVAPAPFMVNSSDCSDGPLASEVTLESWAGETDSSTTTMPAPIGCQQLKASPTLAVTPETTQATSPSGYNVNLGVPQEEAPYSLATPNLRDASVSFPEGTSVSPSAANGLQACTEAQIGLNTGSPVTCPDASKLGTVEITTPLLPTPLEGFVYAATPNANPFNSLLAVYFALEGDSVQVKLAGHVSANPVTGRLTTAFTSNPKVPFSQLSVKLFGGPGAVLSNPSQCGPATTTSSLAFYSDPTALLTPQSTFNVSGCGAPKFAPTLKAGSANSKAGAFSPFSLDLARTDADQNISGIQVRAPRGFAGMLSSITPCPEPQASTGNCPASSKIGHVTVSAGPGPKPFYLPGPGQPQDPVYLTTPYKGAPFGLAVVVPAKAGPFDLGTVITRAQVKVDPVSAQVLINSDPLPQILQGIPLQTRSIHVDVDKPNFTFNPTGCSPQNVSATITSAQGLSATPKSPYAASDCKALKFAPTLSLTTSGSTKRSGNPALKAVVNYPKGPQGTYANIGYAQVSLPHSEFLDQAHIGTVCTRVQFAAGAGNGAGCPAASIYGHATATTPVLKEPLSGPVYLRSSSHTLPDLVPVLRAPGPTPIVVSLDGRIDSFKGGIRTTFEGVPDVPVAKFTLTMPGGKKGLLENSTNLCRSKNRAISEFTGQNGKTYDTNPVLQSKCGGKSKKKSKGHKSGRAH